MKQKIYEPLSEKIYELLPRLKELRLGCKVKCFNIDFGYRSGDDFIRTFGTFDTSEIKPAYCKKADLDVDGLYFDNKRVLGHQITLEDVLEALSKDYTHVMFEYEEDGIEFDNRSKGYDEKKFVTWEYGKPLSEQSDRLGEFLSDILK